MGGHQDTNAPVALAALMAAIAPLVAFLGLIVLLVTVIAPPSSSAGCTSTPPPDGSGVGRGGWLATAYGPPWEGIEGSGVTATGIDLRPAKHAYIIAVDPNVVHLGSYVHVSPNPFGDNRIVFQAADTGSAIIGRHIDIYDWRGRATQNAWGALHVTITPAERTGAGQILEATPTTLASGESEAAVPGECEDATEGPLPLTADQTAKVLPDGLAAAPKESPETVKRMIASGNRLHHASYLYGGAHGPSLDSVQPAYDCSSAVSFVLHAGGVFAAQAEDSTELESYGESGPGKWVTLYANSEHAFMYVAGIRFDTSHNGTDTGPNRNQDGPRWRVFNENPPKWAQWVVRHPQGM